MKKRIQAILNGKTKKIGALILAITIVSIVAIGSISTALSSDTKNTSALEKQNDNEEAKPTSSKQSDTNTPISAEYQEDYLQWFPNEQTKEAYLQKVDEIYESALRNALSDQKNLPKDEFLKNWQDKLALLEFWMPEEPEAVIRYYEEKASSMGLTDIQMGSSEFSHILNRFNLPSYTWVLQGKTKNGKSVVIATHAADVSDAESIGIDITKEIKSDVFISIESSLPIQNIQWEQSGENIEKTEKLIEFSLGEELDLNQGKLLMKWIPPKSKIQAIEMSSTESNTHYDSFLKVDEAVAFYESRAEELGISLIKSDGYFDLNNLHPKPWTFEGKLKTGEQIHISIIQMKDRYADNLEGYGGFDAPDGSVVWINNFPENADVVRVFDYASSIDIRIS